MKKLLGLILAASILVGCGGGDALTASSSSQSSAGSTSSGSSTSSTVAAASISVVADSPQLLSEGNVPVNITATVKDANNVVLEGVTVQFATTSGDLTVTQPITSSSGQAKAAINIGSDQTNRSITISANSGTANGSVAISVVGTTLSASGASSLVLGNTGSYTATLLNSGGKPIAGKTLAISSSNNNQIVATNLVTDSTGKVNFQLRAVNAGSDTLSISGLGLTAQQAVAVSGQSFQFVTPADATKVNIGVSQQLVVTWTNNGNPVVNQPVNFSATRGTVSSATVNTNGSGQASVNISSNVSGPAVVSATAASVSTQLNLSFVATQASAIALQASPATIPTQGSSTLTATVRDANGNLVEGKQVDFSITTGAGTLSLASALTNAQGQAQTVYTASNTASGSNGITISATYSGGTPATANLTVGGQAVFLSLGTGNQLRENNEKTLFQQPWVIQAVDSGGNPVPGANITVTIQSTRYGKGDYTRGSSSWILNRTSICPNEDVNLNGRLDAGDADANNDSVLQPGGTVVATPGSLTTGPDGSVGFSVNYPENFGNWVEVNLTARANVNGTESSTNAIYWLPTLAAYINNTQTSVPGDPSPFGVNLCTQVD